MDGSRGWNGLIEALAFGTIVLLAKMKEITSWYDNSKTLVWKSESMLWGTTEYEQDRLRAPYGGDTRVGEMELLM